MKKNNALQSIFFILGFTVLSTPVMAENTGNTSEIVSVASPLDIKTQQKNTEKIQKVSSIQLLAKQPVVNYKKAFQVQLLRAKITLQKVEKLSDKIEKETNCKKRQRLREFVLELQNN